MATILLTGARGMLGRRLAETLATAHEVVATDLAAAEGIRALDITDPGAVRGAMDETRPHWIVNAAAYTAVDLAETEEEAAERGNVIGPRVLAQAAASAGARMLHVGTDFVFSGEKEGHYLEEDEVGPLGVYARTKADGETVVRETLPDEHLIVRVAWLFGPDGKNFVQTMLRLGAERDRLGVVDDQSGTPTFTRDAAATMLRLIDSGVTGTVHAANQGKTTWCAFAREALRLADIATPVDAITTADYPTPARRPRNSALSNGVLASTIGDTMRPWQEALAAYVAEIRG